MTNLCDFCERPIPIYRTRYAKYCSPLCRGRAWENGRKRKARPHNWGTWDGDRDLPDAEIDRRFEAARAAKQRVKWRAA